MATDTERSTERETRGRLERMLDDAKDALRTGTLEDVRGRVKEALGTLLDDDDLKRAGSHEQATGKAKKKANQAIDQASDAIRSARDAIAKGSSETASGEGRAD